MYIGMIDVWWTASGEMQKSITMLPASAFPPEPSAAQFVTKQSAFLKEMLSTPIAQLPSASSSKRVRYEPSALASFLLSLVRKALVREGVEIVLIQGGAVRGQADYAPGPFTMGQLYEELGFETQQVGHLSPVLFASPLGLPSPSPSAPLTSHLPCPCPCVADFHLPRMAGDHPAAGRHHR